MVNESEPPIDESQPGFAAGEPSSGDSAVGPPVEPPASPYSAPPASPYSAPPSSPYGSPGGFPPPPPPPPPSELPAPQAGTFYSNQQGFAVSGPKNDPFAVTSLATSIPGIPFICCCWGVIGIILGIIAVTFGALSLKRINESNGQLGGKGMAIAGLAIGISVIVIAILFDALTLAGIINDDLNYE